MLPGAAMRTKRVYGEPLEIRWNAVRHDERVRGTVNGEDNDSGRWWIEGDRYIRQWQRWSYAEPASYAIVLDGDRIKFYLESGYHRRQPDLHCHGPGRIANWLHRARQSGTTRTLQASPSLTIPGHWRLMVGR